jgi:hypothetical protein
MAEQILSRLRDRFRIEETEEMIDFTIIDPLDLYHDVRKFIDEKEITMIAFIPHKRSFFRNLFTNKITKKDLLQLNMPLLAVH